jgi:hypothetical protein
MEAASPLLNPSGNVSTPLLLLAADWWPAFNARIANLPNAQRSDGRHVDQSCSERDYCHLSPSLMPLLVGETLVFQAITTSRDSPRRGGMCCTSLDDEQLGLDRSHTHHIVGQ